jgi:hypothetical protein
MKSPSRELPMRSSNRRPVQGGWVYLRGPWMTIGTLRILEAVLFT